MALRRSVARGLHGWQDQESLNSGGCRTLAQVAPDVPIARLRQAGCLLFNTPGTQQRIGSPRQSAPLKP
jgi:hypothetical protein